MLCFLLFSCFIPFSLSNRTGQGRFYLNDDGYINPESDYILDNYFKINTKLVSDLLKSYMRTLPAVYLSERNSLKEKPLPVNITLSYCNLLSINQELQSAQLIVEFQTNWTDPRLKWNASDYYGIENLSIVREGTVWVPDIIPFDTFTFADTLSQDQQTIDIYYDGTVSLYKSTVVEFICLLDLKTFPFDTQTCSLQLTSYNFPSSVLPIFGTIADKPMGESGYSGNGEWTVTNITVLNDFYIGKPDYRPYSNPIYVFTIKRSTTYYVLLIILPSFLLTLLCVVGLFWKRVNIESYMDNLNLGFAAILALMFVLQTVTQDMPKMNGTDKLSSYLLANLTLLTVAIVVVMIVGESTTVPVPQKGDHNRMNQLLCLLVNRLNIFFMILFSVATVINFAVLFG